MGTATAATAWSKSQLSLAFVTAALAHTATGFLLPAGPRLLVPARHILRASTPSPGELGPSELMKKAAELRAEASVLEAQVKEGRAPAAAAAAAAEAAAAPAPLPETLLDSAWRITLTIRGKKGDANTVPIRLSFSCQFSSDDNLLLVAGGRPTITRGYIWAPDRDADDGKTYVAFDVAVQGLAAVPDGKLYLNARVDTVDAEGKPVADGAAEGEPACYRLSDGVATIKEVDNRRGFGLFSFAGILAEFKVVGDFVAAPLRELPPQD